MAWVRCRAELLTNERPAQDEGDVPEDSACSTASLSSSVLKYREIQGRTYHSDRGNAEYWYFLTFL